ncbi:MAG: shikimate dehydrogenase [Candidatus Pacebacteria bacterium]|nr:shikimate dehydrogenase [Candidatus Paceibacterota bacterium]
MTEKKTVRRISGKTRVFGIIADPIGHVMGPTLFNSWFEANNIDAVMVPLHIASEDLSDLWFGLKALRNFGGFLVTIPHKFQAAELCDSLTPMAARIGAVNVVRLTNDGRVEGGMFDDAGFIASLRANNLDPSGKRVMILGAGGAATAIAHGLVDAGVASLTIVNRSLNRAESLAAEIAAAVPSLLLGETIMAAAVADTVGIDLLINTTALGLHPDDPLPIAAESLRPQMAVAEIIMSPRETKLLREASRRGCILHYGQSMLECQFPMLAEFLGVEG